MMRRAWSMGVLLGGLVWMSGVAWAQAAEAPFAVGEPIRQEALTMFALTSLTPVPAPDEVLTFDEATQEKLITVTELEGNTSDAQVNAVHVTNRADKPIFLMSGEVILGGKQDRIIAQNTVVPSKTDKLNVKVFCVEHGRWNGQTAKFQSGGALSHSQLRDQAMFEDSQSAVWNEVSSSNAKLKTSNSTDTYRDSVKLAQSQGAIDKHTRAIVQHLSATPKAVGVAVAINGEVVAIEAFANPKLFGKARDKVVRSYVVEAAATQSDATKSVTCKDVLAFLAALEAKQVARESKTSGDARNAYYQLDDMDVAADEEVTGVETFNAKKPAAKSLHRYYKRRKKSEHGGGHDALAPQHPNAAPMEQRLTY